MYKAEPAVSLFAVSCQRDEKGASLHQPTGCAIKCSTRCLADLLASQRAEGFLAPSEAKVHFGYLNRGEFGSARTASLRRVVSRTWAWELTHHYKKCAFKLVSRFIRSVRRPSAGASCCCRLQICIISARARWRDAQDCLPKVV